MKQDNAVQRLLDVESICNLKAKYCRFIDTKQWERLREVFDADAQFEGLGSAPSGADVDTFIDGISNRLEKSISIHQCHMPEIEFTGTDTARGIWAMMDYVEWPEGFSPGEAPGSRGFFGYGHYEEKYCRKNGEWRISFLRLTRLRVDPLTASNPLPRPVKLAASKDWLS